MASLEFAPGTTISHFRLERRLGEGGMGAVYLAEDLTLARRVAIKFMSRALLLQCATPQSRAALEQRFIREARSAAAINHPNLAQVYEANFDSDNWFIVMEHIDGYDLAAWRQHRGQFTVAEIVDTARQTAAGLRCAWEQHQLLHRDIKPQNIMRTTAGVVKIVDLGLAKPLNEATAPGLAEVTCAGVAVGTPAYMAPEQACSSPDVNHLADLYGLGATLYEMCAGQKAFAGRTAAMIYQAQLERRYVPLLQLRPDLPPGLVQLIERLLEPQPARRLGSYAAVLEALRPLAPAPAGAAAADGQAPPAATVAGVYPDQVLVGRYRVLRPLGHSRAGVVFLCHDQETQLECVVKSLVPHREFAAADLPGVQRRLQKLMDLPHPNLVQVRDVRCTDATGEVFVVMERLKGLNLREYTHREVTQRGALDLTAALPVLARVAAAVDAVNQACGAWHNDLKPESIFLVNNLADVKLLDYGITVAPPGGDTIGGGLGPGRLPLENPDYLAPEKFTDAAGSAASDQYALAVVVYEMLARRLPFWLNAPEFAPGPGVPEGVPATLARLQNLYQHVLQHQPPPVAGASAPVNRVLRRALSKNPAARFPDCRRFIQALARAHRRGWVPSRRAWVATAAGALLLTAGAWLAFRHGGPAWRPVAPDPGAAPYRSEPERLAALRVQREAAALRQRCQTRLAALAAEPRAAEVLAAARLRVQVATAVAADRHPAAALAAWQAARDALAEVDTHVSGQLRRECETLAAAAEGGRQRARHWENWDAAIGEKLAAYDVTAALAGAQRDREAFAAALKLYQDGLALLQETEALARERYQPVPGRDVTVGRVGLELLWLAPLKLWVGKYEVTNRQFRQFKPAHSSRRYEDLSLDGDEQPVCWLRYYDATAFCAWLTRSVPLPDFLPAGYEYRLPTKAEWQAAATAGRPQSVFPWGDDWPPPAGNFADRRLLPAEWKLNGYEDEYPVTCKVQDSGRNAWGLYGMAGNLWEWTSEERDGKRAVFGGSWSTGDRRQLQVELGAKNVADPQQEYDNIGFRVVLGPPLAPAVPPPAGQ